MMIKEERRQGRAEERQDATMMVDMQGLEEESWVAGGGEDDDEEAVNEEPFDDGGIAKEEGLLDDKD